VSNYNFDYIGTIVSAINLTDGAKVWEKIYNPNFENDFGYSFTLEMDKTIEGNVILSGYRSIVPFLGGCYNGYFTERIINVENGTTISDYKNTKNLIKTFVRTNPAMSFSKNKIFFVYNSWVANKFFPIIIDIPKDTIIDNFEFDNERIVTFDISTQDELRSVRIDGPFTKDNKIFTFFAQYVKNNKPFQWLWKTDSEAKVIEKREISSNFSDYYIQVEQKDSLIELITTSDDGSIKGHQGYMIMDIDGNVIRKNNQITIDGKKAGHLSINRLKGTKDVILAVRFQDDNDLFLYRENENMKYIKSAHLINPNSRNFAFLPNFIFQSSDYGIVISGHYVLDTVFSPTYKCQLNCLGWPVIMKLSAKTLGIPTATIKTEHQYAGISIIPNPATDLISITVLNDLDGLQLRIIDQTGRQVVNQSITPHRYFDVSTLVAGLYFVSVIDDHGKQIGITQKLVKM
jgi:hypothetical protein